MDNGPNPDESGGGYSAITSGKLEELLNKGAIYHAGDPVEKTMELYPIFTSYITNIKTVFEGHEQDESELVSERQGVGHTSIGSDDTGVFIQVTGAEADGAFPAGYRFLDGISRSELMSRDSQSRRESAMSRHTMCRMCRKK